MAEKKEWSDRDQLLYLMQVAAGDPSTSNVEALGKQVGRCQNEEMCDGTVNTEEWTKARSVYSKAKDFRLTVDALVPQEPVGPYRDGVYVFHENVQLPVGEWCREGKVEWPNLLVVRLLREHVPCVMQQLTTCLSSEGQEGCELSFPGKLVRLVKEE